MKYRGGLFNHLKTPILVEKPQDINEAYAQAH